jgi:hypothetical protein
MERPPVISSFAATPSFVITGHSSKLVWSVTGASNISISGIGTVTGTGIQVTPAADTEYVLTATNKFGSTQAKTALAVFAPPTTWFAPIGATVAIPEVQGAADYFELFSKTAPWSRAASHVTVFKMYTAMLDLDDSTLRAMFADLKRRHIAFAIEWGPLDQPNGCGIGEGFDGTSGLHYAQRIRDLGGSLQYIAFDEPADGAMLYGGPGACHWTALQTAQNAAKNVAQAQSVFPDVVVGDIEVVPNDGAPDWLAAYAQWVDAWQAVTGKPLAFFHFDIAWSSDWKPAAAALTQMLKKRNIPAGHIYNGDDGTSDPTWMALAETHMTDFETHAGLLPDAVIFQSWQQYPKHLLPETDPTAFTYLIDRYFRTRTTLTASGDATTVRGQLTEQDSGGPIATAPITVTATPLSGTGVQSTYTATGTIPARTRYVTFGVRAGTECIWPLPAAFSVSQFILNAGSAATIAADFTNLLNGWGYSGAPSVLQVNNGNLEVVVDPGESLILNHAPIPFAAVGAPYTFSVSATVPVGSSGNACLAAIFQDATPTEFARVSLPLRPQPISVGPVQTTADGSFSLGLASLPPVSVQLWADYPGTDSLWPAAAVIPTGTALPLRVATASLPDGIRGTDYSQALAASGGQSPYLWVGIGLPSGLMLHQDGTVTGTATAAGRYTVSVSLIDDSVPPQIVDVSLPVVIH